jgi:hypothetical protein
MTSSNVLWPRMIHFSQFRARFTGFCVLKYSTSLIAGLKRKRYASIARLSTEED